MFYYIRLDQEWSENNTTKKDEFIFNLLDYYQFDSYCYGTLTICSIFIKCLPIRFNLIFRVTSPEIILPS